MSNVTPNTTTRTAPTAAEVAEARDVVEAALQHFARDEIQTTERRELADRLAGNVRGWTHTTRVREFLETTTS